MKIKLVQLLELLDILKMIIGNPDGSISINKESRDHIYELMNAIYSQQDEVIETLDDSENDI